MKIAIMQPYLFPYIGYFQLINAVDKFIVYDDVNYIKQGWINRNFILVQGKPLLFTLPLKNQSSFSKINEIEINNKQYSFWVEKFLKTLEMTYKKAPMYNEVMALLLELLNHTNNSQNISTFNYNCLKSICNYTGIKTELISSSSIYNNSDLKAQDRILDICAIEKATIYINPIGGRDLYNKSDFENNGINLFFLKTQPFLYKQFSYEFLPWLSMIDIIMFNSKVEISAFLENYELI
jgi:hypothetical protein